MNLLLFIFISLIFSFSAKAVNFTSISGPYGSGRISIPCTFDNFTTDCILDSGSDRSNVLSAESIMSYPAVGLSVQGGASGVKQNCEWIIIKKFTSGNLILSNHPISRCSGLNPGSVMGIDMFLGKTLDLNFEFKRFNADDTLIPFELNKSEFLYAPAGLVLMPVKISDAAVNALWDTGAGLTAVDQEYASSHPDLFVKNGEISNGFDSFGNSIKMNLYLIKDLKIGSKAFNNVNAIGINLGAVSAGIGSETKIIIGYNIISQANWYIDTRTRTWSIY